MNNHFLIIYWLTQLFQENIERTSSVAWKTRCDMLTSPDNTYNQSISLMGDGYIKLEVLLGTSGSTANSTTEVGGSVALTSTYKQKDYGNLEQTRAAFHDMDY